MKFEFVPKNDRYFEDFNRGIAIVRKITQELLAAVEQERVPPDTGRKIKALEKEGDAVVKAVTTRLQKSFVTPIEREDIHLLAVTIDDMSDVLNGVAARLGVYEIDEPNEDLKGLVRALDQMAQHLVVAIEELRTLDPVVVREATGRVDTLEEVIDDLYRHATKRLFQRHPEAYDLVRWKEVYDLLEAASDHGRHVARTVNHIVVRHS